MSYREFLNSTQWNMKIIFRPICWIKTIWHSINRPNFFMDFIIICGCDYIEQENGELICEVCGRVSK